jgi:histidinol dehydrogenase
MKTFIYPNISDWKKMLQRPVRETKDIEKEVIPVIDDVKFKGDISLKKYTLAFDHVLLEKLETSSEEFLEAEKLVSDELKAALNVAKANIEKFHLAQKSEITKIETMPGVVCWRKSVAIEKVGFYIPGGTAPLFSTVLMLAIPAQIAGSKEKILCTPPNKEGKIHPAILYTAKLCGITKVFKLGGTQAIAAMAYGSESVPQVYKIFGPGNQYVMMAKQLVAKDGVAIDMPAGPSEVAIIANASSNPAFVAADLLSQAEHGNDSQVLLVTTDEHIIRNIEIELEKQLKTLSRSDFASKSLENSRFVVLKTEEEMIDLINEYAAEHLIIATDHPELIAEKIINAGSIFLGHYTPEAAGDYASGTNHTLPTNGYAKAYSGVSLDSFYKKITFQSITKTGIKNIGKTIEVMAENELLTAHKNAVTIRLESLS